MNGYLYRIPEATAEQVRRVVGSIVMDDGMCWTFGGAAQWDFIPNDGTNNLRVVELIGSVELKHLSGDFGHFFSSRAEARWKRRDLDVYDLLILVEDQPHSPVVDATQIQANWIVSDERQYHIQQSGSDEYKPIRYLAYHASNGAVQFQRFVKVEQPNDVSR